MSTKGPALVTTEAPWLGLRAFTEDLRPYFFGRNRELDDLFERVAQKPLTVLFGQSGLGKTSLIQAALMPRLHHAGFVRVLLRLDHGETAPELEQQLLRAVQAAVDSEVVSMPNDGLPAPLWRLLHDPACGLCREGAPRVVLMLDQFEEIFTLGESNPTRRAASRAFLQALAEVVENRVPAALRPILEDDEAFADRIDFGARPLKLLISLREDFLHRLERWRAQMPSLMDNRLELRLLTGPQALQAVVEPGKLRCAARPDLPPIVNEATGAAIVRFVADVENDVPLAEIDAVPPLLSLLCAELNAQRGESPTIRAEQIEGRAEDILHEFYERCFAPHPVAVRRFVEDRLLSPEGFRQNANQDTFLHEMEHAGITDADARAILGKLVDDRLIISEERAGIHRIELTHDTLTGVARTSRDQRLEREEKERAERELEIATRRNRARRLVTAAMVGLTILAVTAAVWALRQKGALTVALTKAQEARDEQRRAIAEADYDVAKRLRGRDFEQSAQRLANTLTLEPEHRGAALMAAALLSEHRSSDQLYPTTVHHLPKAEGDTLVINGDRTLALSHDATHVIVRDPASWKELYRSPDWGAIEWARLAENPRCMMALSATGTLHVMPTLFDDDLVDGAGMTIELGTGVTETTLSEDGDVIAAKLRPKEGEHEVLRFAHADGKRLISVRETGSVKDLRLTHDGARAMILIVRSESKTAALQLYDTFTGKKLWEQACGMTDPVQFVLRSDEHALVATSAQLVGVQLESGQQWFYRPLVEKEKLTLSPDGRWVFEVTENQGSLVYYADSMRDKTGVSSSVPGVQKEKSFMPRSYVFSADSSRFFLSEKYEEKLRIFDLDIDVGGVVEQDKVEVGLGVTFGVGAPSRRQVSLFTDKGPKLLIEDRRATWTVLAPETKPESSLSTGQISVLGGGETGWSVTQQNDVTLWKQGDKRVQRLREADAITAAWLQDKTWLTATANHVALWPETGWQVEDSDLVAKVDIEGQHQVKDVRDGFTKRPLPDGRHFFRLSVDGNAFWGLCDAKRQWVMFATVDQEKVDFEAGPSIATCSVDGSHVFVAKEKTGVIEDWDTRTNTKAEGSLTPEGCKCLAMHDALPRGLFTDKAGACFEYDFEARRPTMQLGRLPAMMTRLVASLPLPDQRGWLIVAELGGRRVRVFVMDAQHGDARPVSREHGQELTEGYEVSAMTFLSPGQKYVAVMGGEASLGKWLWCATSDLKNTVVDQSLPQDASVYMQEFYGRIGFDSKDRFFGTGEMTFELSSGLLHPAGFGVALASAIANEPAPQWLPTFLTQLSEKEPTELLSREELAATLNISYPNQNLFAKLAAHWIGPIIERTPETKEPDDWIERIRFYLAKQPDDVLLHIDAFDALAYADRHAEAEKELIQILALYREQLTQGPLDAYHQTMLGVAMFNRGLYKEAVTTLREASKIFPFNARMHNTLSARIQLHDRMVKALWLSGDSKAALAYISEQHLEDTIRDHMPQSIPIYAGAEPTWVDVEFELHDALPKKEVVAAAPVEKVGESKQYDALYGRFNRAMMQVRSKGVDEAKPFLLEAEKLIKQMMLMPSRFDGDLAQRHVYLAKVYLLQGRKGDANAELTPLLDAPLPLYDRARVLQALGRNDEALAAWMKVARDATAEWKSHSEAAAFARSLGRYDLARECLHNAKKIRKEADAESTDTKGYAAATHFFLLLDGWLAWEAGERAEALAQWQRAEVFFQEVHKVAGIADKVISRADWLTGLVALLADGDPLLAQDGLRELLRERPALGLEAALDGEIVDDPWFWSFQVPLRNAPSPRLEELRSKLKELQAALPEDERIAARCAGLLAAFRSEEAGQVLVEAEKAFAQSPWIALQQAQLAMRDHDDERALDRWQRALELFALSDKSSLQEARLVERKDSSLFKHAGRPTHAAFLEFAKGLINRGLGTRVEPLLARARAALPSEGKDLRLQEAWLELGMGTPSALVLAERAFSALSWDREHLSYDERRVAGVAERGSFLCRVIGYDEPDLLAFANTVECLGLPGKDLEEWSTKLSGYGAPEVPVIERLRPVFKAAAALAPEKIIEYLKDKGEESKAEDWLRALGREDAALDYVINSNRNSAEWLLLKWIERKTPEALSRARELLAQMEASKKEDPLTLAYGHAALLNAEGKKQEAFDGLMNLLANMKERYKLNKSTSSTAERVIALLVEVGGSLGHAERVLPVIAAAPARWPSDSLHFRAAWLALNQGDAALALRHFVDLGYTDEEEAKAAGSSIALWRLGRMDEALAVYFDYLFKDSERALEDHHPKGLPDHLLPELKDVRAAMTPAVLEGLLKPHLRDDSRLYVWKADALWYLGHHDAGIAALRDVVAKTDASDANERTRARYHLAFFMRRHPTRALEFATESEAMAREAARLKPDDAFHWEEWLKQLCLTKKLTEIPAAFRHWLLLEGTTDVMARAGLTAAFDAGGSVLATQIVRESSLVRQKQLLPRLIGMHVLAGEFQQALDVLTEHEPDLNASDMTQLQCFAKAGLGRMDEAITDYLELLSIDETEATTRIEDSVAEWQRLRKQLREALTRVPASRLLDYAKTLKGISRDRLLRFATSLGDLKRWPDAFPVQELLFQDMPDNQTGSATAIYLAAQCLQHVTPPDVARAMHYLSRPLWTLAANPKQPSASPTFDLNEQGESNLDVLCYVALQLGNKELVLRCVEIEKAALLSGDHCIEDYALEHVGDRKGADELHELNLKRFGALPAVLINRAWVLFNRGDYPATGKLMQQAETHHHLMNVGINASERRLQAALLMKQGQEAKAIETMKRAIVLEPDSAASDYYTNKVKDGNFWPPGEHDVLEPLRKATLTKYPELAPKPATAKP